jgi:molybdopterin molybdotransferase
MKKTRNEAKEIIEENIFKKSFEIVTLNEAYGRILFEDIKAKFDIPESDKSAVDGFAINVDNLEFPVTLKITDEAPAGSKQKELKEGAIFIMTGAVVPKGANAVVRIEDVDRNEDEIIISKPVKKGDLINFAGGEIKTDEIVLEKGEFLDYKKISLLANMGYYQIKVYQKPKIGIIVTGDEVKEPFEQADKAGVKNSNYYILLGILKDIADITYYGKVDDNLEEMLGIFKTALNDNDILLSSGGASKGKYDFIKDIAKNLGLDTKFTMTNIRPGRPLIFATKNEKLFFGLPGYPSALLVNFYEFLYPFIKKMAGYKEWQNEIIEAITKENIRSKEGRVDFVRVNVEFESGKIFVKNSFSQQTSNFLSMVKSDALAIIDETKGKVKEGETVEIILI